MVDRSTAAAREESGHLDENVYLESLEWEPAVPEDNQRAFRDLKHREPSVVSRIFGLLTTGHLRQRDKSAHSVPLMYGMQGRSSTSERLILGKSRCWKGSVCLRAGKSLFTMIVVALTIV